MTDKFYQYVSKRLKNNQELDDLVAVENKQQEKHKKIARTVSYPFTFFSAIVLSIIAAVGTGALFPMLPWWSLITFGVLGFVLDTIVFRKSVATTFQLFRYGPLSLISDIRDSTYSKYLLQNNKVQTYIDQLLEKKYEKLEEKIKKKYEAIADEKPRNLRIKMEFDDKKKSLKEKKCRQLLLSAILFRKASISQYAQKNKKLSRKEIEKKWRMSLSRGENAENLQPEDKISFMDFCQAVEKVKKDSRKEWITKATLVGAGSFFPLGIGVAFGSMAAIHILELFTVYLALSLSGGVVTMAILGAALLGFTYMLLMYKHLYSAVTKNIFKQMFDKFQIFSPYWKDMDTKDKIVDVVGSVMKVTFGIIILSIGAVAVIFSAGALIDATFSVTIGIMTWAKGTLAPQLVEKAALITNIVMSILILPIQMIFGIQHSLGGTNKIAEGVKGCVNIIREKKYKTAWSDIKKNPLKAPLYAFGFLVAFTALIVHIVTEAIAFSGEGAASDVAWTGTTYKAVTDHLVSEQTAVNTIIGISTVYDFVSHGDFVVADAQDKKGITRAPYNATMWAKEKITEGLCNEWNTPSNSDAQQSLLGKPSDPSAYTPAVP